MMTKPLLAILLLLPLSVSVAKAQTTTPGGACHSVAGHAKGLQWRAEGLSNKASTDYWVNCPIQRPAGTQELDLSLRVHNASEETKSLTCTFNEWFANERLQRSNITVQVDGGASGLLTWSMTPRRGMSVTNASCKLTQNLIIEGLTVTRASRAGNDAVQESGEVYACITSPRKAFYERDAEVEMKNGAILNNYDGRGWSSGTSYLLFRAYSGNWYTFKDFDKPEPENIQKEDLVKEPETCFAFDEYQYVEDKYEGGSKGALMVINGREIAVYDSCRIDVGAPVWGYVVESYGREDRAWIFDLSSGRECEIFVP